MDKPRPVVDHLEELRSRLFQSLIWFVFLSIGGYFFVDPIVEWLSKPVGQLVFTRPTEAFFIRLKVACGVGVLLSVPVFLFHAWRFVEVALQGRTRSFVGWCLPLSYALFAGGVLLAVGGVTPVAIKFLLSFGTDQIKPFISVQAYLSFLIWMMVGFGLFFQVPLIVLFLSFTGLVKTKTLARYRRHVIVGFLILAALLSPGPDIFSQLILTLPSYFLFEISLFLAKRFETDEK